MSQAFLLRAEAVNLGSIVYDTSRLPTVRGGGLMLMRAPEKIGAWLREDPRAQGALQVRSGASACVFAFAAEPQAVALIRDELERRLGEDEVLKHATFVVDVLPTAEGAFVEDLEKLLALNRFRQMRSPSVSFPSEEATSACAIDGIRPGISAVRLPGEQGWRKLSNSVRVRTDYGRLQKQAFYREEAGSSLDEEDTESRELDDMRFVRDFQELAKDPRKGRLDGKIAVLYLDGNGFGAIQKKHCRSREEALRFDETLQRGKRTMLKSALAAIRADPDGWTTTSKGDGAGLYRLETLLWGGDEMLFVAPAWKGWWLSGEIFSGLGGLEFGTPLTFAGGLVLCHANAPIRRMKKLAEKLAGEAKSRSREESFLAYQVMESFDVVPGDFAAFRNRRSAFGDSSKMALPATELRRLEAVLRELRTQVPRKRLYRLTKALLDSSSKATELQRHFVAACDSGVLERLEQASGSFAAGVLHLAELWDYLPESSGTKNDFGPESPHAG